MKKTFKIISVAFYCIFLLAYLFQTGAMIMVDDQTLMDFYSVSSRKTIILIWISFTLGGAVSAIMLYNYLKLGNGESNY